MDEQRIEVDRLAMEAKNGSQQAKLALYEQCAGLLLWEAKRIGRRFTSLNIDDVRQELYLVFEKAVKFYNAESGSFATFFVNACERRASEIATETRTVPLKRTYLTYRIFKAQGKPLPKNGEKILELAKAKIFEFNEWQDWRDKNAQTPLEVASLNERAEIVNKALNCLPERDREIVKTYYGIDGNPLILEQIGAKYGITRERVRQIINRAKRKLKLAFEMLYKEGAL